MKILRLDQVVEVTGIPRSTLYRYVKNRQFPAQVKLGQKIVGWVEEEVVAWIKNKIELRNTNMNGALAILQTDTNC
jgi:prophage regulatory protein